MRSRVTSDQVQHLFIDALPLALSYKGSFVECCEKAVKKVLGNYSYTECKDLYEEVLFKVEVTLLTSFACKVFDEVIGETIEDKCHNATLFVLFERNVSITKESRFYDKMHEELLKLKKQKIPQHLSKGAPSHCSRTAEALEEIEDVNYLNYTLNNPSS